MSWMVTGGAGYIGSHVVRALQDAGLDVVVLDDLSSGHREFVPDDVRFVDRQRWSTPTWSARTLDGARRHGVVHLAGLQVRRGLGRAAAAHLDPERDRHRADLLERDAAGGRAPTSSSPPAQPPSAPRTSTSSPRRPRRTPSRPTARASSSASGCSATRRRATGLRHTSLRYFNVVGSGYDDLYDTSPHNLFPIVFEMLLAGKTPRINGTDYPTPDGTCVRDYLHVSDLAASHAVAAAAPGRGGRARARLQPRQRRPGSPSPRSWTRSGR